MQPLVLLILLWQYSLFSCLWVFFLTHSIFIHNYKGLSVSLVRQFLQGHACIHYLVFNVNSSFPLNLFSLSHFSPRTVFTVWNADPALVFLPY